MKLAFSRMIEPGRRFLNDARGVTALEYGLIAAVAAGVVAAAIYVGGERLAWIFYSVSI